MPHSKSYRAILKVSTLAVLLFLLLWLICYNYVSNISFQIGYLVVANIFYAFFFKPKANLKLWRIWYKKMISFFLINVLVAYLDLQFNLYDLLKTLLNSSFDVYNKMTPFEYHKHTIARIILTLMNTILTLDGIIKLITFSDLILLPISLETKKKMLFFKSIFNFLTDKIKMNEVVIDTIPEYQFYTKRNKFLDFKYLFNRNLISIFTMLKLVTEQSIILGELIDNKINHSNDKNYANKKK